MQRSRIARASPCRMRLKMAWSRAMRTSRPIPTNNSYNATQIFSNPEAVAEEPWYGNEQENTLLHKNVKWPLGWQSSGYHLNLSTRNSGIRSLIRVSTVDLKLSFDMVDKDADGRITEDEVREHCGFMEIEFQQTIMSYIQIRSLSCCAALWLHGDRVSAKNHVLHSSQIYAQALLNDNWKY